MKLCLTGILPDSEFSEQVYFLVWDEVENIFYSLSKSVKEEESSVIKNFIMQKHKINKIKRYIVNKKLIMLDQQIKEQKSKGYYV